MTRLMKHNPAFLDDDELVASFRVRQADFELIVETLHENIDARANQHLLVVGPRGMGKTTLVRRVAIEARRDDALRAAWFPIVFGEESYAISDAGEFWLEAILHLADALDEPAWYALHETLLAEPDGETLRVRALARLMEFAAARDVRLLVVVENLQMVLDEQLDEVAASSLRHTLQTEPRIMLLGTAASRFDAIEQPERPLFELFRVQELEPLTEREARTLWDAVAERPLKGRRIRPVHILTGGNPRLLSIVAAFSQKRSFGELMTDLVHLVDDHTTYFKANVESLPPGERKVLVALADLWSRATSRQVAERARLSQKKASAYLKRLGDRGVVKEVDRIGRVRLYELTERLYNIYHLMRRRGGEQAQVRALVEFMIAFYGADELGDVVASIAAEACILDTSSRRYHLWALAELVASAVGSREAQAWREMLPAGFFELPDLPMTLAEWASTIGREADVDERWLADLESTLPPGLAGVVRQAFAGGRAEGPELDPDVLIGVPLPTGHPLAAMVAAMSVIALEAHGRWDEAMEAARAYMAQWPEDDHFRILYCTLLRDLGSDAALSEAETVIQDVVEARPSTANAWHVWALVARDPVVAEKACVHATDLEPGKVEYWTTLGVLRLKAGRFVEAAEAYERALALNSDNRWINMALAACYRSVDRPEEATLHLRAVLNDIDFVQRHLNLVSGFFVRLAAAGLAGFALDSLLGTAVAETLMQPMLLALRFCTGSNPQGPRELMAVAADIVEQIERRGHSAQTSRQGALAASGVVDLR